MRSIWWTLLVAFALGGCSAALSGHRSAGSAGALSGSNQAQVRTGQAVAGISFGTPAPSAVPGGHASLSRGASVAVILALAVADVVHYFTAAPAPVPARTPGVSIAETCSCYGYQPPGPESYAASGGEKAMP